MLSHYKTPLARLGDPVARVLLQAHVRPNHLTVLGLGVSIVAAGALAGGRLRMGALRLTLAVLPGALRGRALLPTLPPPTRTFHARAPFPPWAPRRAGVRGVAPLPARAPVRAPAEPDVTRLRPSA